MINTKQLKTKTYGNLTQTDSQNARTIVQNYLMKNWTEKSLEIAQQCSRLQKAN